MVICRDRENRTLLIQVKTGVAPDPATTFALERTDKHTIRCRLGENRLVFRSVRPLRGHPRGPAPKPRGPAITLRIVDRDRAPAPCVAEPLPGVPDALAALRFEGAVPAHLEQMDESWFWGRAGGHTLEIRRPAGHGLELVIA